MSTTCQKNVGRVLANEEAVKEVLRKGNLVRLNVEDTAKLSYYEQLKVRAAHCAFYKLFVICLHILRSHDCGALCRS